MELAPLTWQLIRYIEVYLLLCRQEDTLIKSVGEGKIFYQPDEADDFDEEDPDDDLDI